jgi:phosphoglycolate phosphatase
MAKQSPSDHYRAVLFDLDGTLADTAPDLAAALNHTLERHGHRPLSLEQIKPSVSHGAAALIRLGFGLEPDDEEFEPLRQELLSYYSANNGEHTTLFSGMSELLEQLEQHDLSWGVVTNKPAWLTDPLMQQLGLTQRADSIVSGDTTSHSKPHPEPILHACRQIGCTPSECLFVGDAKRDIVAGKSAGTTTLIAMFGYLGRDDKPAEWQADGTIEQPADILQWVGIEPSD